MFDRKRGIEKKFIVFIIFLRKNLLFQRPSLTHKKRTNRSKEKKSKSNTCTAVHSKGKMDRTKKTSTANY